MSDGGQHKQGLRELGPAWITAISSLIVALTGAGFFAGRVTAHNTANSTAAHPSTVTVVETTPVPVGPATQPAATSLSSGPSVYWSGELDWGQYDLDFNPPRDMHDGGLQALESSFYVDGEGVTIAEWVHNSIPSENDCASVVVSQGSNQTNKLEPNTYVCGKTVDGRTFRVDVVSVGDSGIRSQTVVWNK